MKTLMKGVTRGQRRRDQKKHCQQTCQGRFRYRPEN
jgi:hypothetical protein